MPCGFMAFLKRPRDCIGTNLAYLVVFSTAHSPHYPPFSGDVGRRC